MWVVIYGEHWLYLKNKDFQFKTKWFILAILVYLLYYLRYFISMFPVKYIKIHKVAVGNVLDIRLYKNNFRQRKTR